MTKRDELLECLRRPETSPDQDHSQAEKLLIEHLREIGDGELADAWVKAQDEQNWWYA